MASDHPGDAVRQINRLFRDGTAAALTDGQLIERFTTRRAEAAEAAFEALVNRHGPMVLRVCRGLLRDPHDVDDAFQATFLVLVRKADRIGERDLLGPWLYGVAHRVALKARGVAARRSRREGATLDDPPADVAEGPWLDIRPVLHEELNRLPEKYRKPIVLCHLQGLTHAEAAQELAWPVGTVSVRLARARKLLKERLTRRGLTVTATLWAAGLSMEAATAAVPESLLRSTATAALHAANGKLLAAGTITAGAAQLTQRTLTTMTTSYAKWLIVPLAIALGAVGGVAVNQRMTLRAFEARDREARAALAAAEKAREAEAAQARNIPPIPDKRSPFDMGDGPPEANTTPPADFEGGQGNEEPIKVKPPVVVNNGRIEIDPPPGYFDLPAPNKNDGTDPPTIKPGQVLQVEILETLPGRPITGERVVRPDGTISLGFYGDLKVAGLNRLQAKVKLIEHMRKYLTDEILGLLREERDGTWVAIPPVESSRVIVDDSLNYHPDGPERAARTKVRGKGIIHVQDLIDEGRIKVIEGKLHRIAKDLNDLKGELPAANPASQPQDANRGGTPPNDFEKDMILSNIKNLEYEIYMLLKELKDVQGRVSRDGTTPATPAEPSDAMPKRSQTPPPA